MKKGKWLCERHTDLKTGRFYDTRKGMNSKTLFLMFGDDRMDAEKTQKECCNTLKVISETCYEVHHKDPLYHECDWATRIELIPA